MARLTLRKSGARIGVTFVTAMFLTRIAVPSVRAATYGVDVLALSAFQSSVASSVIAANWSGSDPCGEAWLGVTCVTDDITGSMRVSSLVLDGFDLVSSQLPSELGQLTNLTVLSLAYNQGLTGSIPAALGNLTQLATLNLQGSSFTGFIPYEFGNMTLLSNLYLNNNKLTGVIPWTVGKLANLVWFDISNNSISGPLPFSPGLETLTRLQHIHFQDNSLNGTIPSAISNLTSLLHIVVNNNELTGDLPDTIGDLANVKILSLAYNSFTSLPSSILDMPNLEQLSVNSNQMSGSLLNITNNSKIVELDLGNNNFSGNIPEGFGWGLSSLITLDLGNCNLTGVIPDSIGMLPRIQSLNLSGNSFNGSMPSVLNTNSSLLELDLEANHLTGGVAPGLIFNSSVVNWFYGNPICAYSGPFYLPCQPRDISFQIEPLSLPCTNISCNTSSGYPTPLSAACTCVLPLVTSLYFSAPPFQYISLTLVSDFESHIANLVSFATDQVQVIKNSGTGVNGRPYFNVAFFPNSTDENAILSEPVMFDIVTAFSTHRFRTVVEFGPLALLTYTKPVVAATLVMTGSNSGFPTWQIFVILIACFLVLFLAAGFYVYLVYLPNTLENQKRRFQNQMEQYRCKKYALTDLAASTQNFSDSVKLGRGGFAVVYHGKGPDNEDWAVKRAIAASAKSLALFWTEVEAISKLNHVNILKLLGYCDDNEEQILVYEFCAKGTVNEHLWKDKGKPPLPYLVRLKIASGLAAALEYLHSFSSPGLIHRDVKTDNVLLTENMQAKLADFTLLKKLNQESSKDVAGTPGYMDPEYVRTGEVTTFSDVFSFGVVLLELLTGRPPTFADSREAGEVRSLAAWAPPYVAVGQVEKIIDLCLIEEGCPLEDLKVLATLAAACVERLSTDRPDMSEVVNRLGRLLYRNKQDSIQPTAESRGSSFDARSTFISVDEMSNTSSVPQVSFMSNVFEYAPRD